MEIGKIITLLKGTHTISKKILITRNQRVITFRINSDCETWNSIGKHMVQDSEFVRWSSAFHHVFVFTVKKRCVLLIEIIKYNLQIKLSCVKIYFFLPARNYKAQSDRFTPTETTPSKRLPDRNRSRRRPKFIRGTLNLSFS